MIELRKNYDIITTGNYQLLLEDHPQIFAYVRNGDGEKLLVVANFFGGQTKFVLPNELDINGYTSRILLSNYNDSSEHVQEIMLRPYEAIVYHLTK